MSERTKTVETKYMVCDACGYVIGKDTGFIIVTIAPPSEESVDLHFHLPAKEGDGRSWGTKNCLVYWIESRNARSYAYSSIHADKQRGATALEFGLDVEPLGRPTPLRAEG